MTAKYASELKELGELLNQRNDDKVKWCDVLLRFCGLDLNRQLAAANRIGSSQLSTLIDVFQQAKVTVLKKEEEENKAKREENIASMLELLAESGLTPQDLINNKPAPVKKVPKAKKKAHGGTRRRFTAEQREALIELCRQGVQTSVIKVEMKQRFGIDAANSTIYKYKTQVKVEEEQQAAAG